jgi:hypothetical protein
VKSQNYSRIALTVKFNSFGGSKKYCNSQRKPCRLERKIKAITKFEHGINNKIVIIKILRLERVFFYVNFTHDKYHFK